MSASRWETVRSARAGRVVAKEGRPYEECPHCGEWAYRWTKIERYESEARWWKRLLFNVDGEFVILEKEKRCKDCKFIGEVEVP